MKTLVKESEDYLSQCYPFKIGPVQFDECQQAFMSGALVAMDKILLMAGKEPPEIAFTKILSIREEARKWCENRANRIHAKTN